MTDVVHPDLDELADLRAGLTEPAGEARLTAHLASCTSCTAALAALDEVTGLLAAVAEQPPAMPSELADSLDAQLRRLGVERQADVPSLAERRPVADTHPSPPGARWARQAVLGAAATVLAVTGVWGIAHLGLGSSSSNSATSDSAGSAAREADVGNEASGDRPGAAAPEASAQADGGDGAPKRRKDRAPLQALTPQTLPRFAVMLARTGGAVDMVRGESCATGIQLHATSAVDRPTSDVRWRGNPAVVLVLPRDRRVSVFSCEPPLRRLYSARY